VHSSHDWGGVSAATCLLGWWCGLLCCTAMLVAVWVPLRALVLLVCVVCVGLGFVHAHGLLLPCWVEAVPGLRHAGGGTHCQGRGWAPFAPRR
jgi:hypothetical protein